MGSFFDVILDHFLESFLASFLESFLKSFLDSFLASFLKSFLDSFFGVDQRCTFISDFRLNTIHMDSVCARDEFRS